MAIRRDLQDYAHDNPNQHGNFYWKETAALYDTPSFAYYYTYDDNAVFLHDIMVI